MFDHVTLRVADQAATERFYTTVMATLGIGLTSPMEWDDLSVGDGGPPTTGLHVGFGAASREMVDAFWRAGVDAGFSSDGEPGPRPQYTDDYYGGFLLDPDGNSIEAVHHRGVQRVGYVDHIWLRVADLRRSRDLYAGIAEPAGYRVVHDEDDRVQFRGASGSMSLVPGEPTRNVHIAFASPYKGAAADFHAAGLAAGGTDNGGPGERAEYHPGYYAAFLLDPDGNNIEVVDHNR